MQLAYPQHYVVKTQDNYVYYFYLNNVREICYKLFHSENYLIREERLVSEMIIDFSVAIKSNNTIQLVCITNTGKLLYYFGSDRKWKYEVMAKFDIKSNIYKYLLIKIIDDGIHIFYLKTNLINLLVSSIEHMYWNKKTMQKTTVASYVVGKHPSPYHIDIDEINNIHMLYKCYYKKNHQLFYCKFNYNRNIWTSPELISDLNEDHCHPYILLDKKNNLHLVWCSISNNNFILKYKMKKNVLTEKSTWSQTQTLSQKNTNYLSPIVFQEGSLLKVLSKQNNYISEMISKDYGESWIISNKNFIIQSDSPLLFRYLTNNLNESLYYSIQYVYGEIIDQINIFGTKLFQSKNRNPSDLMKLNNLEVTSNETQTKIKNEKTGELLFTSNPCLDSPSPTSKNQFQNSIVNLSKELLKKNESSVDKKLIEIESLMNKLTLDLRKIQENDKLSEKLSSKHKMFQDSDNLIINEKERDNIVKTIENTFHSIPKEKNAIKQHLDIYRNKLEILEGRLDLLKKELVLLQREATEIKIDSPDLLYKILDLFR